MVQILLPLINYLCHVVGLALDLKFLTIQFDLELATFTHQASFLINFISGLAEGVSLLQGELIELAHLGLSLDNFLLLTLLHVFEPLVERIKFLLLHFLMVE